MKLSQTLKHKAVWWLAHRLPACQEILPMVSQAMETPLSWSRRMQLKLHLMICRACTRYAEQLALLRETARRQQFPEVTMPERTRAQIQRVLAEKAQNK